MVAMAEAASDEASQHAKELTKAHEVAVKRILSETAAEASSLRSKVWFFPCKHWQSPLSNVTVSHAIFPFTKLCAKFSRSKV